MTMEAITVSAVIPVDLGADDIKVPLFKAPPAANGGGITLVQAQAHNSAATSSTVSFTLALVNLGSTGASVAGTIGAAIGGTTSHWAVRTPKAWTLDATEKFVDAAEWVGVHYNEINAGNNGVVHISITYLMGN